MQRSKMLLCVGLFSAAAASTQADTLSIGIATEPWDLDPAIRTDTASGYLIQNIYDPLVEINANREVTAENAVAKSWKWSNGLKTLTMQIREGIKFHDGTDLTAEDVAYNITWQINPENNAPLKGLIGPVSSVEVKGPYELVVNFEKPYPDGLQNWARALDGIVPEGGHGKREEEKGVGGIIGTELSRHPVGSGPYEFVEWVSGSHIALRKTDDYWQDTEALPEEVDFEFISDPAAKMAALISGSIQIVDKIPYRNYARIEAIPSIETKRLPGVQTEVLYLDLSAPPFGVSAEDADNPEAIERALNLRKFLYHAIDRKEIAEDVFYGMATVQSGPWFPDSEWTSPAVKEMTLHDEELARKYLEKAGLAEEGFSFKMIATNAQWFVDVATIIQNQLRPYGVKAEVVPVDKAAYFDLLYETTDWDVGVEDWGLSNFSALSWLYSGYYRNNHNHNHWHHASPDLKENYHPSVPGHDKFVALYDKAATEPDTEKRKELVWKMQDLVTKNVIQLDMMFLDSPFGWRSCVGGYGEGLTSQGDINLRFVTDFSC